MTRMTVTSRVGSDGVLHVAIPVGLAEANREVRITVEPALPPPLTPEEWRDMVNSLAGSIDDPSFVRHDQGEYERRESL